MSVWKFAKEYSSRTLRNAFCYLFPLIQDVKDHDSQVTSNEIKLLPLLVSEIGIL